MTTRQKKKQQSIHIRKIIYNYIKTSYNYGSKVVKMNDELRISGYWWKIFDKDINIVKRWLRKEGYQFKVKVFIPIGLGVPGWVFYFNH